MPVVGAGGPPAPPVPIETFLAIAGNVGSSYITDIACDDSSESDGKSRLCHEKWLTSPLVVDTDDGGSTGCPVCTDNSTIVFALVCVGCPDIEAAESATAR